MRRLPEDDPDITSVEDLFVYHIFGKPRQLAQWQSDGASYALQVKGLVDRPLQLSRWDIEEKFEPVSAVMVLQCTTNVHWGRLVITGARLLDVLQQARVQPGAWKVALHGADGFDTDLALADIRQRPDRFLLAYAMNGRPIPPDHGFPLRIAAEGKYGYKWCKWLVTVEVVDHDYLGHYEGKRGWSDAATRGEPL